VYNGVYTRLLASLGVYHAGKRAFQPPYHYPFHCWIIAPAPTTTRFTVGFVLPPPVPPPVSLLGLYSQMGLSPTRFTVGLEGGEMDTHLPTMVPGVHPCIYASLPGYLRVFNASYELVVHPVDRCDRHVHRLVDGYALLASSPLRLGFSRMKRGPPPLRK